MKTRLGITTVTKDMRHQDVFISDIGYWKKNYIHYTFNQRL